MVRAGIVRDQRPSTSAQEASTSPSTADFDGDGKADLAVYRPSTGQWFVEESSTNYAGQLLATFGGPKDIPVPANYNGNGKADVAVYRPTTGQWFF